MEAVTREQVNCQCMGEENCEENREVRFLDGTSLPSIPYLGEGDYHRGECPKNERCHDCGCLPGKFHHPGCDMEICPRCRQQAIQCGCLNDWEALEQQEKQVERGLEKQSRAMFKSLERERRERERQILKQDAEHRRLHREGYTFLCNGGPAPVNFSDHFVQEVLAKKCVQQSDVVQCSTTYDNDGKLITGEISLWAKIPKVVARKSEKTFESKRVGPGTDRARWAVWYDGNADIKGYGLTKKEAISDLETRHNHVRLAKLYPD